MSNTKFTWALIHGSDIFGPLGGESGDGVCADDNDGWQVAEVGLYESFVDGVLTEQSGAVRKKNISILLAAPDLYAALENILRVDDEWHGSVNTEMADARSKARAALAKARGES